MRARTRFTVPNSAPPARGAQLSSLLRTLSPANELPLRIATYTYAEPARRALRVVISAEAGSGEGVEGAWMGFVLIDAAGVIAATAALESPAGRHAFSTVVPEGRYTLRAAAIDPMGREGSVERVFVARLEGTSEWRTGDLMLAPVPATPTAPLSPIVDHATGDAIVAYVEIQATRPVSLPGVRVEIARGPSDPPLASAVAVVVPGPESWVKAQAVVPIAGLPPGAYVARAEIQAAGAAPGRVSRPFTIAAR